MRVELLNEDIIKRQIEIMVDAGRTCYDSKSPGEESDRKLMESLYKNGHHSVFEHLQFQFKVTGVSRALLQEQARHRMASYSVKSTRYTLKKMIKEVYGEVTKDGEIKRETIEKYFKVDVTDNQKLIKTQIKTIRNIFWLLFAEFGKDVLELPNDELKYLFPESLLTSYVITINFRSFINLYELRSSKRALQEFQELAKYMFAKLPRKIQNLMEM